MGMAKSRRYGVVEYPQAWSLKVRGMRAKGSRSISFILKNLNEDYGA
jgi:hypothetical protein